MCVCERERATIDEGREGNENERGRIVEMRAREGG